MVSEVVVGDTGLMLVVTEDRLDDEVGAPLDAPEENPADEVAETSDELVDGVEAVERPVAVILEEAVPAVADVDVVEVEKVSGMLVEDEMNGLLEIGEVGLCGL